LIYQFSVYSNLPERILFRSTGAVTNSVSSLDPAAVETANRKFKF